ncbi:hypothetical protein, partial [Actinomadura roseirufa]|uniref:hypothetical protein n=1 Tax=Actinomadura roseirufa TaxID=2094049 RepID=UPI001A9558D3
PDSPGSRGPVPDPQGHSVTQTTRRCPESLGPLRHQILDTGHFDTALILRWSGSVLELADHVDYAGGDQNDGSGSTVGFALRLQAAHLRWAAAYMAVAHFSDQAHELVQEQFPGDHIPPEQPAIGDLTRDDLGRLAIGVRPDLIPPRWDRDGWDYTHPAATCAPRASLDRCPGTRNDERG